MKASIKVSFKNAKKAQDIVKLYQSLRFISNVDCYGDECWFYLEGDVLEMNSCLFEIDQLDFIETKSKKESLIRRIWNFFVNLTH